jgi:peptidoglycan hydrolase-like protein with peptidoglycan-binding domain
MVASSAAVFGCSEEGVERRPREAQEKILGAIPNQMAVALAQEASPEEIKQAQQALTVLKEYMGEINGKLDPVTINAIQAFQRTHGLEDDGILDAETKKLLAEVKS